MDDDAAIRRRLTNKFRTQLDEPLIIALLSDYKDLTNSDQLQQATNTLDSVSQTAALEELSGFNSAGLGVLDGSSESQGQPSTSNGDQSVSVSASDSTGTSRSEPVSSAGAQPRHPQALESLNVIHTYDDFSQDQKLVELTVMFQDLKEHDIRLALQKHKWNMTRAIEELLNIQFLEASGERQKGIDAFFDEDDTHEPKTKKKGKRKGKGKRRAVKPSTSAPQSWSQNGSSTTSEADGSSEMSAQASTELSLEQRKDIEFISSRLDLVEAEVAKVYLDSDSSPGDTVGALLDLIEPIMSEEAPYSLRDRIEELGRLFPNVPKTYLRLISEITSTESYAQDIARLLDDLYTKPGKKKLQLNYGLTPLAIETDVPELQTPTTKGKTQVRSTIYVNKPIQPTLALRPLETSAIAESSVQQSSNVWATVQRRQRIASPTSETMSPSTHLFASRDAAFRAAVQASRKGSTNPLWRQAAAVYNERATLYQRQATAAQADELAHANSTSNSVDLHGVYVNDGVRIARKLVQGWWDRLEGEGVGKGIVAKQTGGFRIITGWGRHSEGGRSRLRPAVLEALLKDGWRVLSETGVFIVMGRR